MSLFSFGRNRSSSQGTSLDLGYGYQGSQAQSESLQQARSISGGASGQEVFLAQMFEQLYGSAAGATQRAAQLVPALQGQAAQLFGAGSNFLQSLGGGAGAEHLQERMSGQSPVLDQQIAGLQDDVGRLFREELNPAITARAVGAGGVGGARQGVAQGRAMEAAAGEFQRGATALRASDMSMRDQAAQQLMAGQMQGAGTGLGALPGMMGLAEAGMGAEMAPWASLAQIMGGPTALTASQQFGESVSDAVARSISESFGEDIRYGTSQQSMRSSGFNFGF